MAYKLKKKYKNLIKLLSVLIVFICVFSLVYVIITPNNPPTKKQKKKNEQTVSLVAVGDNMIHEKIYEYALKQGNNQAYNFDSCYKNIKKDIQSHDLAFINQETMIVGDQHGITGYPAFNTPQSMIDCLENTGFNLVNTATNHSYDQGIDGIIESCRLWKQHPKMLMTGIYDSPQDRQTIRTISINGITFSFLSYTFGINEYTNYKKISQELKNNPYSLATFKDEEIKQDVEKAKALSDIVIVYAHWGLEGKENVTDFQKQYAQLFANLGVDLVLGSHNHSIQPIEWYQGNDHHKTLVCYGLGNFLSTMKGVENQLEGMVSLDFEKTKSGISIKNITYTPLVNHYDNQEITIYHLKDYNNSLAGKHSILKDQGDIIKTFKTKVKSVITNKDVHIEM